VYRHAAVLVPPAAFLQTTTSRAQNCQDLAGSYAFTLAARKLARSRPRCAARIDPPRALSGTLLAPQRLMKLKDIDWRAKLRPLYRFANRLPRGVRTLAGLLLIVAGVFGIVLPVLGSWMAPLGLLFIAADVPPLRRRVDRWFDNGASPQYSTTTRSRELR
jgi:hypothetical protein